MYRGQQKKISACTFVAVLMLCLAMGLSQRSADAQGLLTVTPGRTTTTVAGTGHAGYSGDAGAATSANFAQPAAVAYNAAGDLFLADTNNHVIRKVEKATGNVLTVAGTGIAGFSGDGAAATDAQLDTPTGVAVDTAGNLYIADSHNNRIRKVTGTTITTIAGGGTDTGNGTLAATSVALATPTGVAVDAAGNVFIADTNHHSVRKLSGTTISTVAGNGEQMFAGDGGAATLASLDSPTGVAVDAAGNLYIADRLNHRIRVVNSSGVITTLAGTGTPTFAGGFSGDGGSATAASLARPTGVAVDAVGNLYVADTNNFRLRQIGNGGIATLAGDGTQGTDAALSSPRGAASNANGSVVVADATNQRALASVAPTLNFDGQGVGNASASQTVTLTNSGNSSLTLTKPAVTTDFQIASGGTCPSSTISLAPGASCTLNVTYVQSAANTLSGSLVLSGPNVPSQTVLLSASSSGGGTSLIPSVSTVTSSVLNAIVGQSITYTLQVSSKNGTGTPSGTLLLTANGAAIGSVTLSGGAAQITRSFTGAGAETIVATYSGDAQYASSSGSFTQTVQGFTLAASGTTTQTVRSSGAATYTFAIAPASGAFSYPVTFTATGVPIGSTVLFNPYTVTPGSTPTTVTMTVRPPQVSSVMRRDDRLAYGSVLLGLLVLPLWGRMRRRMKASHRWLTIWLMVASFTAVGSLAGCGSGTNSSEQQAKNYDIVVKATGTGTGGATLDQTTTVHLTVE